MSAASDITTRPIDHSDADFLHAELACHWGGTQIWSLGRAYEADTLPGFIAELGGERLGEITYAVQPGGYQCEVVTLSAVREGLGIGSRLLNAAVQAARAAGCIRIFLTTTNDNIRAIGFYQLRGWRLAALHKGNVDEARKRVPTIPRIGPSGIPIRDEVELELWLQGEQP